MKIEVIPVCPLCNNRLVQNHGEWWCTGCLEYLKQIWDNWEYILAEVLPAFVKGIDK